MELVVKIVVGLLIGTVGTLVGTGGGWAMVPTFLLLFAFGPTEAAATSLLVVCLNALSGTAAYVRQKRVNWRMATVFGAATVPGALVGTQLNPYLDVRSFSFAFGVFLLLVAGFLAVGRDLIRRRAEVQDVMPEVTTRMLAGGGVVSVFVGVVSSILGVGGGIIHVPFLILVLGLPLHVATATSHAVLAATSLVGVVGYALEGQVRWGYAVPMGLSAMVGAQLGARLSHVLPAAVIQKVMAVLLAIFAVTLMAGLR